MTLHIFKFHYIAVCFAAMMVFVSPAIADSQSDRAELGVGQLVKEGKWRLRLPNEDFVSYSGVVSYDAAGMDAQAMLYPAPGLAGFLVAVVTHGVIVDAMKKSQKTKLQMEADKVLLPYQEILSSYTLKELMQRGLEKAGLGQGNHLIGATEKAESDWNMESMPTYSLTQDQNAIILENTISIYAANAPAQPAYQNTVRIISATQTRTDLQAYWTANQGAKLKEESASLFAESLSMVFFDIMEGAPKEGNKQKTVRYMEGANEKIERGQIISEQCNRIVFKTLRGWLMSVPDRRGQSDISKQCDDNLVKRL